MALASAKKTCTNRACINKKGGTVLAPQTEQLARPPKPLLPKGNRTEPIVQIVR